MFPVYSIKNTFTPDQEEELKPDMHKFSFVWLKGQHIRHITCWWWKKNPKQKKVPLIPPALFFGFPSILTNILHTAVDETCLYRVSGE